MSRLSHFSIDWQIGHALRRMKLKGFDDDSSASFPLDQKPPAVAKRPRATSFDTPKPAMYDETAVERAEGSHERHERQSWAYPDGIATSMGYPSHHSFEKKARHSAFYSPINSIPRANRRSVQEHAYYPDYTQRQRTHQRDAEVFERQQVPNTTLELPTSGTIPVPEAASQHGSSQTSQYLYDTQDDGSYIRLEEQSFMQEYAVTPYPSPLDVQAMADRPPASTGESKTETSPPSGAGRPSVEDIMQEPLMEWDQQNQMSPSTTFSKDSFDAS